MKKQKVTIKQPVLEDDAVQIARTVQEDFAKRRDERRSHELAWQLNINFMLGNQYSAINSNGEIENINKQYFWQQREVFNHIAPIIESRISKLCRVRPSMTVVPTSNEERDIYSAKLSRSIIKSFQSRACMNEILTAGTKWSEICGTVFYKILWNSNKGSLIGQAENGTPVADGDIDLCVVPPYEIFPETLSCDNIEGQASIIHARAYHISEIKTMWGIDVKGEDIDVLSLDQNSTLGGLGYTGSTFGTAKAVKQNHAVIIEKYEKPTAELPCGRLTIVCGEHLLYMGELPLKNKADGEVGYPFVRQVSLEQPCCFFGQSIIDRCIPVQRAYNAVKNRKHEFLNRLSMGVYAVEDGSVDTDNLEEEGMSPGKIVIYRQGSTPPRLMDAGSVPNDLSYEEDKLLQEFMHVSGVSDLMRNSRVLNTSTMSGVALQLLIEQDDSRMSIASDQVRFAALEIAKQAIRLYRQFATVPRLIKVSSNSGELEIIYFKNSDLSSDDVVFETESEISETLAQKRSMVMDLLKAGLLSDEDGKLNSRMRAKALELLGFGLWETAQDVNAMHIKKADSENLALDEGRAALVGEFDDHKIHLTQHINHLIGGEISANKNVAAAARLKEHIKMHKQFEALTTEQIKE